MEQNKYRFINEGKQHLHQIFHEDQWKNLTGTSGIPNVLAKPLTWWASGLAMGVMGWIPKKKKDGTWETKSNRISKAEAKQLEIKNLTGEAYLNLLDEGYAAHSKTLDTSAKAGTDLHALAEAWIKGQIDGSNIAPDPSIMPLVNWSIVNVDKWLWSEVHCYSETHWLGGISDAGFVDKQGRIGILDIKSSKEAYISQFIQCAGYDIQLTENGGLTQEGSKVFDLQGKKIDYYAILPFGMEKPEPQIRHNTEELKGAFLACLLLYKLLN